MSPRTQRRAEAMGAHPPPGPPRQCRGQQLRGSRGGQLASRQLTVLLAALAPRARAQNCSTVDTFVAVGEMTDCGAVLATGLSCADLACYAPSIGNNVTACAVQNPGGYAGQCSLTCAQNLRDGVMGEGACAALLQRGDATCDSNFTAGANMVGECGASVASFSSRALQR